MEPSPHRSSPAQHQLSQLATPTSTETLEQARARALERLYQRRVAHRAEREMAEHVVDRRKALQVTLYGAVTGLAWTLLGRSMQAQEVTTPSTQGVAEARLGQIGLCAWETLLFTSGHFAAGKICHQLRLPLGNAGVSVREVPKSSIVATVNLFEKDPLLVARLYTQIGWMLPAGEELIFRILPSWLLRKEGMQWQVGIPMSLAFAAAHNLMDVKHKTQSAVPLSDGVKLSLDTIPLPQFLLGAFCWYVMRKYGDLAPILAHALNNQAAALAVVLGGKQTYAEFKELLAEEMQQR